MIMMTLDLQDSGKLFVTPRMALFTVTLFYTGLNQANSPFSIFFSRKSKYIPSSLPDEIFEPGHLGRGSDIIYWLHQNVRYHHSHHFGHQGIILIYHYLHLLHGQQCQHLSTMYQKKANLKSEDTSY